MRAAARGIAVVLLLVSAACATSQTGATPSASHMAMKSEAPMMSGEPMMSGGMMSLPAYASGYHASFSSPSSGAKITSNSLAVAVKTSGFDLRCDLAGKGDEAGTGHYHLLLDKVLVNMFCTPDATVSMQNVSPGTHTLEVLPALNEHDEVTHNGASITFDYEPTNALPVIAAAAKMSESPSIKIISPKPGASVSGAFDVVVQIKGFATNCDLFGKPGVEGYGHWHVNLDTTSGAMMGMGAGKNGKGGMLGMSCTRSFQASTTGLSKGESHKLVALLVGNAHDPLNPPVSDAVDVTIG